MPKTQSALLEAMAEQQVTVDGETRVLPDPFLLLATENPIEYEGTFPLPEAQLDRFFLRTALGYPDAEDERRILDEQRHGHPLRLARARDQRRGGPGDQDRRAGRVRRRADQDAGSSTSYARRASTSPSRSARRCAAASRSSARRAGGRSSTSAATSSRTTSTVSSYRCSCTVSSSALPSSRRRGEAAGPRQQRASGTRASSSAPRPVADPDAEVFSLGARRGVSVGLGSTFPLAPRRRLIGLSFGGDAQRAARHRLRRRRLAAVPARRRRRHDRLERVGAAVVGA